MSTQQETPVSSDEEVYRQLFSPFHYDPGNGKIKPFAFTPSSGTPNISVVRDRIPYHAICALARTPGRKGKFEGCAKAKVGVLCALEIDAYPGDHPNVLATPVEGNPNHADLRVPTSGLKGSAQKAWQRKFSETFSGLIPPQDPPQEDGKSDQKAEPV